MSDPAGDTIASVATWFLIAGIHSGVSKCFAPCFGTDLNMKASLGKHWWKLSPVVHFIIYLNFITTASDADPKLSTKQEYANLIAIPIGLVLYLCSKLAPRWASADGRISFAAPVVFHSINWFVVWIDFFTVNQFEWPGFVVCIWMFLFWAELTSCLHSIDCYMCMYRGSEFKNAQIAFLFIFPVIIYNLVGFWYAFISFFCYLFATSGAMTKDEQRKYVTFTYSSGSTYVGQMVEEKKDGYGTYKSVDGWSYVGQFKDDKPHGYGTNTWANGNVHNGDWKNGKEHGYGCHTKVNGDKLQAEWKEGKLFKVEGKLFKQKQ